MPYVQPKKPPEEKGIRYTASGIKVKAVNLSVPVGVYDKIKELAKQDGRHMGPWITRELEKITEEM